MGPNHLTVEWDGISDPQSRVQGYILEYRRLEDPSWREFDGVIRHDNLKRGYMERITGLNPDTAYVVRIKVVYKDNKVSDPSPQAEARTGCQGTMLISPVENFNYAKFFKLPLLHRQVSKCKLPHQTP